MSKNPIGINSQNSAFANLVLAGEEGMENSFKSIIVQPIGTGVFKLQGKAGAGDGWGWKDVFAVNMKNGKLVTQVNTDDVYVVDVSCFVYLRVEDCTFDDVMIRKLS